MADWTLHAREALEQGPAALVTILATEGSAPRGPGARMVVTQTGLAGSIGGGRLEHQAMAQARSVLALAPGSWRVQDYPLGPLLGQCCGGRVRLLVENLAGVPESEGPFEVTLSDHVERSPASAERPGEMDARGPLPTAGTRFLEPVESDRLPVFLFGAGHVGKAIAERAAGLPLALAWYDSRPEMAGTPGVVLAEEEEMMVAQAAEAPEDSAIVILTHDHGLDYRLVAAALGGRARFVGLIGSATKRARFLKRLAADKVDPARLTCPIGLAGIGGREPEVIAIAVLAQLLTLRSPA
jgi:xanthine dehydrogenase accessory factor